MKNLLNNSSLHDGASCSLCQDKLLRHISQSRIFWYCPSCRQEMVSDQQEEPPTAAHFSQATQQHPLAKAVTPNRRTEVPTH